MNLIASPTPGRLRFFAGVLGVRSQCNRTLPMFLFQLAASPSRVGQVRPVHPLSCCFEWR